MKLNATGLLRHRFFGEYSAKIVLKFDDGKSAELALPVLKAKLPKTWSPYYTPGGGHSGSGIGISAGEDQPYIVIECTSEDLETVETILEGFGADKEKISSMGKSIDYGEQFEIGVNVEDPRQMTFA